MKNVVCIKIPIINMIVGFVFLLLLFSEIKVYATETTRTDVPQIYITTDDGNGSSLNKEYVGCKISIIDSEEELYGDVLDESANVKVRGNSTASGAKKPYAIKFDSKVSVLGMPKAKKWVLLANMYDPTLLRNKIALDLAKKMNFSYTPSSRFVDVYMDGQFRGNYLLTEKIEQGTNRLNIDTSSGDYLIEMDWKNQEEGISYITSKHTSIRFEVNEPSEPTEEEITKLSKYLENVDVAITSLDYKEYSKYVDVDTFVDMFLLNQYMKNVDFNALSTFFYFKNGVLYAGPVWDFDLSSGNVNSEYYTAYGNDDNGYKNIWSAGRWYYYLLQSNEFNKCLQNRYYELQYYLKNVYSNDVDNIISENRESFNRNYTVAGWNVSRRYSYFQRFPERTYEANVEMLKNWLQNRNEWLLTYWNITDDMIDYRQYYKSMATAANLENSQLKTLVGIDNLLSVDVYDDEMTQEKLDLLTSQINDAIAEYESYWNLFRYNYEIASVGDSDIPYGTKEYGYHPTDGRLNAYTRLFASVDGVTSRKLEWSDNSYETSGNHKATIKAGKKNKWSVDNPAFFKLDCSTKGCQDLTFSADLGVSGDSPKSWKLQYGYGDGTYYDVVDDNGDAVIYTVTQDGIMEASFTNVALKDAENHISDDKSKLVIRLIALDTNNVDGGTNGEVAIDNICLNGKKIAITQTEPEDETVVTGTPYKLVKNAVTDKYVCSYDVKVPHVLVNSFYGCSDKDGGYATSSYIELYNPLDEAVSLDGWSLHYKSSLNGKYGYGWEDFSFPVGATIESQSSYLVTCNEVTPISAGGGTPQMVIPDGDAEWNIELYHKGGSVVLTFDDSPFSVDEKAFDNDNKVPLIDGYVDMISVSGNDKTAVQEAPVFEGKASAEQSKKKAVRRILFKDTDNGKVGKDVEIVDLSYSNEEYRAWFVPRNSTAGSWTASDCPKYNVTFDLNNGLGTSEIKSFTMNTKPVVINEPVWEDHTFMGWYSDVGCTAEFNFDSKPTANITVYAGWKVTDVPNAPLATMSVNNAIKKISEVELPDKWVWNDEQSDLAIPAGGAVSAEAVYNGDDREDYYNLSVTVKVSRAECISSDVVYSREGENPPTCINTGLGHKECTVCGDILEDNIVTDKLPHAWNKEASIDEEPGCETTGSKSVHCSVCDAKDDATVMPIEALGHTGGTATCHTKAVCERCEKPYGEYDASNHDSDTELRDVRKAECEEEGYTGDTYCKGCDAKLTDGDVIEALGHTGGTATCHAKAVCVRCEKPYGEYNASNHNGETEIRNVREADYGVEGYTGDTYCKGCGTKVLDGRKVPALVRQEDNVPKVKKGDKLVYANVVYKVTSINATGENTVEYVGFAGKNLPRTVKIPDKVTIEGITYKVTSIGKKAFKGNKKLKKLIIGDNVSIIGDYAFYKASALKTVQVGKGLTKIGKYAFAYDKKLTKVSIKSTKLKIVKSNAFKGTKNVKVVVNKKILKRYKKQFKKMGVKLG